MTTRFLKILSNGNEILKYKLMTAPSYMIIINFSFPFSIARELDWEPINDFSTRAIEEAKEQIEDTEKQYVNDKIEMESKSKAALENQQDLIR